MATMLEAMVLMVSMPALAVHNGHIGARCAGHEVLEHVVGCDAGGSKEREIAATSFSGQLIKKCADPIFKCLGPRHKYADPIFKRFGPRHKSADPIFKLFWPNTQTWCSQV